MEWPLSPSEYDMQIDQKVSPYPTAESLHPLIHLPSGLAKALQ